MRRRCLGRSGRPGRPPGARLGPGCGRWRAAGRQEATRCRPAAAGPARVRGRGLGGLSPSVEGAVEGLASWNVPPRRSRSARVPGRPGTKKVPATRPITASMSKPRVGVPDPPWSPHHRPHGDQGPVDRGRVRSRPRPAVLDRRGTDRATGPRRGHNRATTGLKPALSYSLPNHETPEFESPHLHQQGLVTDQALCLARRAATRASVHASLRVQPVETVARWSNSSGNRCP